MINTHTRITQKLDRFLGLCKTCVLPMAVEKPGMVGDFIRLACPSCSGSVKLERLYGTETSMTCDPRCEGAVGPSCECACGGANHGAAFLETGEVLASAVNKYRTSYAKRSEATKKVAEERAAKAAEREKAAKLANMTEEERWVLGYEGQSRFLLSLRERMEAYMAGAGRGLSDRQIAAVRENMARRTRDEVMHRTPKAERRPCPDGESVVIEGVVVKLVEKEMANGPTLQGRIRTDAGWSAWGTIPLALREAEVQVGSRVRFSATLRRQEDVFFGFWSYPEGGQVLTSAP